MNAKFKNIVRFILFLGIGILFVWLSLRKLSSEERLNIIKAIQTANYWWIALSLILGILSHILRAVRWKMLIKPLGYQPRNLNMFFSVFIGYFANMAIPRLGEVTRCTILTRYENVPFNKGFGTVITERAIDLIIFFLLFTFNLLFQYHKIYGYVQDKIFNPIQQKINLNIDISSLLLNITIISVIVLILVFVVFRKHITTTTIYKKIKKIILGFLEGMKTLLKIDKPWLFVVYSLSIWLLYLLTAYILFFSLPGMSSLGLDAGLTILVFGSIGIMLTPGGMGVYPIIVAQTVLIYGPSDIITNTALGWLIWSSQTITIIVIGILSLIFVPIYNKSHYAKNRIG